MITSKEPARDQRSRLQLRPDAEHLAAFVIAARSASSVRLDRAPALRALVQKRSLPAVRRLARAQAHFRGFTFGDSHKKGSRKAGISKKTNATASIYPARSNPEPVCRLVRERMPLLPPPGISDRLRDRSADVPGG